MDVLPHVRMRMATYTRAPQAMRTHHLTQKSPKQRSHHHRTIAAATMMVHPQLGLWTLIGNFVRARAHASTHLACMWDLFHLILATDPGI